MMDKDLATPAPRVESAQAAPACRNCSDTNVEPPRAVEAAYAEPAKRVEAAELYDDPRKHAPANALKKKDKSKISVETLREQGVDFESRVGICRGAPRKNFFKRACPFLFDQRDFITFSEIARYAVIQRGCCFVFLESTDPAPLYAFSMHNLTAEEEDPAKPDSASYTVNPTSDTNRSPDGLTTVLLRNSTTRELTYQFTFDTDKEKGVVKRFLEAAQAQGKTRHDVMAGEILDAEVELAKS